MHRSTERALWQLGGYFMLVCLVAAGLFWPFMIGIGAVGWAIAVPYWILATIAVRQVQKHRVRYGAIGSASGYHAIGQRNGTEVVRCHHNHRTQNAALECAAKIRRHGGRVVSL